MEVGWGGGGGTATIVRNTIQLTRKQYNKNEKTYVYERAEWVQELWNFSLTVLFFLTFNILLVRRI